MILSFLTGLFSLAWISFQDWKNERFNLLVPLAALFLVSVFKLGSGYGYGFLLNIGFAGILFKGRYLRIGDIIPVMVYGSVYSTTQSFFTLLATTGLYLYTYPMIADKEKENLEWVPFIPALLTAYIIQTLLIYLP